MATFGDDGDGQTREPRSGVAPVRDASPVAGTPPPSRPVTTPVTRPRVAPPPLPSVSPGEVPRSEPISRPLQTQPPSRPEGAHWRGEQPASHEPRTTPITTPITTPSRRTATRKRRKSNGWFKLLLVRPAILLLRVVAILLPLCLLAVGGLYLRLMYEPVSVTFLADPIERSLNAEMPDFSFQISDAVLQRSASGGIEFRLQTVSMNDATGNPVALARQASIELDLKALLGWRITPSRVDLIDPRFLLFYDEHGKLSLKPPGPHVGKPSTAASPAPPPAPTVERTPAIAEPERPASDGQKLAVTRLIANAMTSMRRDGQTGSRLSDFGLKNATIVIDEAGRQTEWRIPEFEIDLHLKQKRSIVLGRAVVASAGEPWTLQFRAEESEKSKSVRLAFEFENIVPRMLARQAPAFAAVEHLEAPVAGKATVDLDHEGNVTAGTVKLDIGRGAIHAPWAGGPLIGIDTGRMDLRYHADSRALELLPSPLTLSIGTVTLAGRLVPSEGPGGVRRMRFELASREGVLAIAARGKGTLPIDELSVIGHHESSSGRTALERFVFKAGGVEIEAASSASRTSGPAAIEIEGRIKPVTAQQLLAVWPPELAPRTRNYLAANLQKGSLSSGSFRVATGDPDRNEAGRLALSIEAADVELELVKGLPPLEMPRALIRVEGTSFELTIPEGQMTAGPGRRLMLRGGRFTTVGMDTPKPIAEIAGRIQGPVAVALELLDREPLALLKHLGVQLPPSIDGRLDVQQLRASLTLGEKIDWADARLETKIRITDGRVRQAVGNHDVTGATITIEATEKTAEVKGDLLLAGVVGRLQGRWSAGQVDSKQPVGKLSVKVDDADRAQLGLDLDRIIRGPVPLDLLLFRAPGEPMKLKVAADLTGAELMLDEVHWTKPPGRPARLEFDLGRDSVSKTLELQNFKLDGENIAIDGWVSLGPDNKARAFYFPEFLLNVVSNMEVQGTMRPERVWDVKVRGKTPFDAGDMLRAMLAFGNAASRPLAKERPGVDLLAEFDTILGLGELRLKHMRLKSQKRADQVVAVDFSATLDSGRPLAAMMKPEPGRPRVLRIETTDAGQALKLIGFYQNMVGGNGTLELNLDGRGAAERHGTATITGFRLLGDPIAAEVFQAPDGSRPAIDQGRPGPRRVVREEFDFELLKAPFAIGNGQLIIEDAVARGPLIGASLRGKVDFRTRRLNLGGTYIPLSGLNRVFTGVPILEDLLGGPRGEGVFGLTFLINGAMANPQVTVNPFSGFTPGLLRELMQMVPEGQTIAPRADPPRKGQPKGAGPQIRASPPTEVDPGTLAVPRVPAEVLDGWSTDKPVPSPRKK